MKRILLFSCFIFTIVPLFAQNLDEINQILDRRDTKSEKISQVRRVLLDKFLEDDIETVEKLTLYLKNELSDENYSAIYPAEFWLLCYWTGNYKDLLENIFEGHSRIDPTLSLKYMPYSNSLYEGSNSDLKIEPQRDILYEKIKSTTIGSKLFLQTSLYESDLADVEKDFLAMFLDNIASDRISFYRSYFSDEQEQLNKIADEFLEKHPDSPYEEFTRDYLRYKQTFSKWGFGYDFGGGVSVFEGKISETFGTHGCFHIGMDITYARFMFQAKMMFNFPSVQKDFNFDNITWQKDGGASLFMPDFSLAYSILDNNILRLSPFFGFSPWLLSPNEAGIKDNPDLEDLKFNAPGYVFGVNIDYKMGEKYSYGMIRLRYSFYTSGYKKEFAEYPELNGHLHNISLSLGVFGRNLKRDR